MWRPGELFFPTNHDQQHVLSTGDGNAAEGEGPLERVFVSLPGCTSVAVARGQFTALQKLWKVMVSSVLETCLDQRS